MDAVRHLRGSTRAHGAPRRRRGPPRWDGGPGGGATASRGCRPRLWSDSPRVDRSVRGGGPLSGSGGGALLHAGAALPAVANTKIGGGSGISACGSGFLFTAVSYHGLLISAVRCCSWLLERPQSSIGSGCWRGPNHPRRGAACSCLCWLLGSCLLVCTLHIPIRLVETGYGGDLSYSCVFVNVNFTLYIFGSLMPTATIASMNNCLFLFVFAFLVPVYRCTLLL